MLWIPVIQGQKGLYFYLQAVQGYLAPPIFVVFFLGVFNKRLNSKGCLSALVVGFLLGVFRLAVDTPVQLQIGRLRRRLSARLVPLDRQQHLLPILQRADLPGLHGRDDRRELCHRRRRRWSGFRD